jgi:hypothetical protein
VEDGGDDAEEVELFFVGGEADDVESVLEDRIVGEMGGSVNDSSKPKGNGSSKRKDGP